MLTINVQEIVVEKKCIPIVLRRVILFFLRRMNNQGVGIIISVLVIKEQDVLISLMKFYPSRWLEMK